MGMTDTEKYNALFNDILELRAKIDRHEKKYDTRATEKINTNADYWFGVRDGMGECWRFVDDVLKKAINA